MPLTARPMVSRLKGLLAPQEKAGIGYIEDMPSVCFDQDSRYVEAANQRLSFALWVVHRVRPEDELCLCF